MAERLRWGIIGTGAIAEDFTNALRHSARCEVISAAGSSPDKSRAFAGKFALRGTAATLEELVGDDGIDAVYVATPHPMHERHATACIEAGKHVLCEKPITVDAAGAERVIEAARAKGVFLMEAFMYRCHPMTAEIIDKLKAGVLGAIRHVRADFSFFVPRQPGHRLYSPDLAGGGILDVGGYPASFARLVAGVAAGKPVDEPVELHATGHLGPTGIDELAIAQLRFDSGLTAQLTCGVNQDVGTGAWVFGEKGTLHIPDPWIPQGDRQGLTNRYCIREHVGGERWFEVTTQIPTYGIEAELVASVLPATQAPWPAMSWDDTLGNMRLLDAWREQVGVVVATTA